MKRLSINFAPAQAAKPWIGFVLLALGVLLTVASMVVYVQLNDEVDALSYRVDRLKYALSRADAEASDDRQTPVAGRGDAALWSGLLDFLGEQLGESVTLLAIHGGVENDQLSLQGEAKDPDAMFAFIGRLESGKVLTEVAIQTQETVRDNPYKPVRFSLTASWKKAP